MRIAAFFLLAAVWAPTSAGETFRLSSGERQVATVELFTSHGCSSCPPADRWLSGLLQSETLWRDLVPMAFHVDYWDHLGWRDRFARPAFTARQQAYRQSGGTSGVYTPGFVVKGREWRSYFWNRAPDLSSGPGVGKLVASGSPGATVAVEFAPGPHLTAHLVVLGFNLVTPVGGGENAGKELHDDFVVLGYSTAVLDGAGRAELAWPALSDASAARMALAAWVSRGDDPAPVQAVGGWLP